MPEEFNSMALDLPIKPINEDVFLSVPDPRYELAVVTTRSERGININDWRLIVSDENCEPKFMYTLEGTISQDRGLFLASGGLARIWRKIRPSTVIILSFEDIWPDDGGAAWLFSNNGLLVAKVYYGACHDERGNS